MHKPHAPTNTKNRKSEDSHIGNNKNNGNPIMMVANTKMELSELTGITKNRNLMIERKAEPTKHSIEQSKVNRNSKMIVVNSDTCQVDFQKTEKCGHKFTTWVHRRHAYVLETEVHNKHGKFLPNFKHSRFNNKPHLPRMPRKTVKADKKAAAKAPTGTVQHLFIYILTTTGSSSKQEAGWQKRPPLKFLREL